MNGINDNAVTSVSFGICEPCPGTKHSLMDSYPHLTA